MKRFALVLLLVSCGGKKSDDAPNPGSPPGPDPAAQQAKPVAKTPDPTPTPTPTPTGSNTPAEKPATGSDKSPNTPLVSDAPEGNPPPDGKYEKVVVDGTTVPLVQVMDGGKTVLVDTDGKKPRTWEEQYKQKKSTKKGQLDVHKTDSNHNNKFDDDTIDKEGLWLLDVKGNITKH